MMTLRASAMLVAAWMLVAMPVAAREPGCTDAAFGARKVGVDGPDDTHSMPKGLARPGRGIVVESAGLFINEGRSGWLVVDVEKATLTHVVFLGELRMGASEAEAEALRAYRARP